MHTSGSGGQNLGNHNQDIPRYSKHAGVTKRLSKDIADDEAHGNGIKIIIEIMKELLSANAEQCKACFSGPLGTG